MQEQIRDYVKEQAKEVQDICEHEFVAVEQPMFCRSGWHVDQCVKCGVQREYDTSD